MFIYHCEVQVLFLLVLWRDSRVLKGTSKTAMIFFSVTVQTQPIENLIGHFRVRKTLTFKTRLSAKPFMWKNYFISIALDLASL